MNTRHQAQEWGSSACWNPTIRLTTIIAHGLEKSVNSLTDLGGSCEHFAFLCLLSIVHNPRTTPRQNGKQQHTAGKDVDRSLVLTFFTQCLSADYACLRLRSHHTRRVSSSAGPFTTFSEVKFGTTYLSVARRFRAQ